MSVALSRRGFLAGGASLAGIGSAVMLVPHAAVAAMGPVVVNKLALRRSAFLPLIGHTFRIAHDRGSLAVTLRQVTDLQPSVRRGAEDQFSLIFTDDRLRPVVPQGTYVLSHPHRGRISLFIVPIGLRRTAQQYQVIVDSRPRAAFRKEQS